MNKPWDLKSDDSRIADSFTNFIIISEDGVCEPIYFKYFETPLIKINNIKNKKSMMANVLSAIHYCEESGLTTFKAGELCIDEGTQVWCVFDRDKEETQEKVSLGNVNFNESIETAKRRGIRLATSNDAFELWILLHFEDIRLDDTDRETYYSRLTKIFRNLPDKNEELIRALAYRNFSYKGSLKSENNFREIVRKELVSRTNIAIRRAKELEKNFSGNNIRHHEKCPYTSVHYLVEELVRVGRKTGFT